MAETSIEWTDATWNPTSGCTKISPGCAHCYIERTPPMRMQGRRFVNGKIPLQFHDDRLGNPLHWRDPRRIFVNSMSDLFHADVPFDFIDRVFAIMALASWHTFQVLTKRADRMQEYIATRTPMGDVPRIELTPQWYQVATRILDAGEPGILGKAWSRAHDSMPDPMQPLPNVWLGVSVEDQRRADERIPLLLETPAAVRFLSCEPLLGPVDIIAPMPSEDRVAIGRGHPAEIDWCIVGGESGKGARPMHPAWVESLLEQCGRADVAFFFKQWGEWAPLNLADSKIHLEAPVCLVKPDGRAIRPYSFKDAPGAEMVRAGKKLAGRLLDGREWNEMPKSPSA